MNRSWTAVTCLVASGISSLGFGCGAPALSVGPTYAPREIVARYDAIGFCEEFILCRNDQHRLAMWVRQPTGKGLLTQVHWQDSRADHFAAWAEVLSRKVGALDITLPQDRTRNGEVRAYPTGSYTVVEQGGVRRPVAYDQATIARATLVPRAARSIRIAGQQVTVSIRAQRFLTVVTESTYASEQSVLIVEDPHFDTLGQWCVYRGLSVLLAENEHVRQNLVFLTEGLPHSESLDLGPLLRGSPKPDADTVHSVLDTYLIPGHVAYAWSFDSSLTVRGAEDASLYQQSAHLWADKRYAEWAITVVARNTEMARSAVTALRAGAHPILFVGGMHNTGLSLTRFGEGLRERKDTLGAEARELGAVQNQGIFDVLQAEGVGYVFLTARKGDPPELMVPNQGKYRALFKAQLSGDWSSYVDDCVKRALRERGVTVRPSPAAAAQFLQKVRAASDGNEPRRRAGDAKAKEKEQVRGAANAEGITSEEDVRDFGDYVEEVKRGRQQGSSKNLTFKELRELAREFKDRMGI